MNNGALAPTPLSSIRAVTDFMLRISEQGPDASQTSEYITGLLDEVRTRVSHLIKCNRDEVILTQSTTEGLNMVARGIRWSSGDPVIVRGGRHEHLANYLPWLAAHKRHGIELRELAIDEQGDFDMGQLEKLSSGAKLVTMSHVLYNTGAIMPLEQVGKIALEKNMLFCVDAAQSAGTLEIDVKRIGCHFMAFPGFKWLCGPTGIGILYCSKDAAEMLEPQAIGGESATLAKDGEINDGSKFFTYLGTPARFQAGFRNYPGAAGLEASLRYVLRIGIGKIRDINMRIARNLREEIEQIPGVKMYGPEHESRRSSIVTFIPPAATDPATLVKKLEGSNIIFAARDLGGSKKGVRAAPHFFNSEEEARTAVSYVKSLVK